MKKIEAIVKPFKLDEVREALSEIGVTGLTGDGITVADHSEAQLKAAVLGRARRVVVPVDASKIGISDFALVALTSRSESAPGIGFSPAAYTFVTRSTSALLNARVSSSKR